MKSYKSYEKYLNSVGYFLPDDNSNELCYDVVCGVLKYVTLFNKEYGTYVRLRTSPNAAYQAKLDKMKDGDNIEINPYNYNVTGAYIPCPICNIASFIDNCKDGISLVEVEDGYNPHLLKDFKKCIWIQNHPMEQEEFVLKNHMKNMKRIKDKFLPILKKFDFFQYYSSLLDCDSDNSEFVKSSSNPLVIFKHKTAGGISENLIYFETDCINGKLKIQNEYFDSEDFENYIIENIMTDKYGKIDLSYKYLFDKDYKPTTWKEVFKCSRLLTCLEEGCYSKEHILEALKMVDFSLIPAKDYQGLLDAINKFINV